MQVTAFYSNFSFMRENIMFVICMSFEEYFIRLTWLTTISSFMRERDI